MKPLSEAKRPPRAAPPPYAPAAAGSGQAADLGWARPSRVCPVGGRGRSVRTAASASSSVMERQTLCEDGVFMLLGQAPERVAKAARASRFKTDFSGSA